MSLRKRIPPSVSSSLNRWVDWGRSDLTRRDEVLSDTLWQTFFATDHFYTCTTHSGDKKDARGDIEIAGYLANATGPVPLLLDLRLAHECWGSSADPNLNGNLHYPDDKDRSLNEAASNKIRKY